MSLPARGRRRREPLGRFALRALMVLTLLMVTGGYLCDRFRIGIDDQQARCLGPTRWYLIDTHDQRPTRGQLVAFAATDGMAPYFTPGQTVIKRVVGVPGDRVSVDAEGTTINGIALPNSDPALAGTLQRPSAVFFRQTLMVPEGQFWVMGDTRDSFDARYWGLLSVQQVRGRAYALF
jgi:conjugal transfer pilin signal peptidase TrbI